MDTEASIDLAQDEELLQPMVESNFASVFIGIETPDEASLSMTKKFQNTRGSLSEAIDTIIRAGLRPMAGFIIGFDGEKQGAGERIVRFVESAAIPTTTFAMLQALPNTALWHRLEKEGRMRKGDGNINQTTLMNFEPTRPLEDIAQEYVDAFWRIYDPKAFLDRNYRCFMKLGAPFGKAKFKFPPLVEVRALLTVMWRQGIKRETRWMFWHHFFGILINNPAVFVHYISVCAHNEHFLEFREIVRAEIAVQLAEFLAERQEEIVKIPIAID